MNKKLLLAWVAVIISIGMLCYSVIGMVNEFLK